MPHAGHGEGINLVAGIPIRNLWLLMLYASDLFRHAGYRWGGIEENPDDIPDLVAELLAAEVERRLARNLTNGYVSRQAVLARVRGRVDFLRTERRRLLERGMAACRYEALTVDTLRNRFVRSALESVAKVLRRSELKWRCQTLSGSLKRMGVSGGRPSWSEASADRVGRHDLDDRRMMEAARLAFEMVLPTEAIGSRLLHPPDWEIHWVRRLYEKAVAGFYCVVLTPSGWRVEAGKQMHWQVTEKTSGISGLLPSMRTDIVLERRGAGKRIVIDTKFTSILTKGWHRDLTFRSAHIYQIYAYLRSQVGTGDARAENASGILLHPAIDTMVDEAAVIQGHEIRFATVDLGGDTVSIRRRLLELVSGSS